MLEEVTRSWRAPFSARNRCCASSIFTTLDVGAAEGYVDIPPVEHAIAMQLCPQSATAWRGNPRLPSRTCKFSSSLTAKAYSHFCPACYGPPASSPGQGVEAVLHKGSADPGVVQELRTPTAGPGSDNVQIGVPGAPPMADLGRYEGD